MSNLNIMNIPKAKRIKLATLLALVKEIKTDDGSVLFIEGDLTVDTEVFVSDADGNMVPAPDGVYVSEGKTITVAAGKIAEIKEVEADPATDPDPAEINNEDNPDPATDPDPKEGEDVEALKARIAELEATITEKDSKIAELEAKIAELEKEPAADPIEDEEKRNKFNKETTLVQRLLNAAHSNSSNRITNIKK